MFTTSRFEENEQTENIGDCIITLKGSRCPRGGEMGFSKN
jgi:hypothetical protein